MFSSTRTSQSQLLRDILSLCTELHEINIDSDNFLKLFHIHNFNGKILRCVNEEVKRFDDLKKDFDASLKNFDPKERVDLYFEFQVMCEFYLLSTN